MPTFGSMKTLIIGTGALLFSGGLAYILFTIKNKLIAIMANLTELAEQLTAATEQNEKARAEIVAMQNATNAKIEEQTAQIAALEEALANAGNTTPEIDAAMAALKASIQADDDMNADSGSDAE